MKDTEKDKPLYEGDASFSPYPLHVSSPPIKPEDKRLVKANAYEAMQQHAQQQISMLRRQADLILAQAREIEERVEISRRIYEANFRFVPDVGQVYHLFTKSGKDILTMVGPDEWGDKMPYDKFIASLRLLADKSWEIIRRNEDIEI
ncbi:MAG TPA: DUF2452 domain-containing protein [Bacteroidia bacterium]|nr:DUF2452 domain-containing protein [Bacteroidia bacterium]